MAASGRDAAAQAVAGASFAVAGRHCRLLETHAGGHARRQKERALLARRLVPSIAFTSFAGVMGKGTAVLEALGIQKVRTATLRTT